MKTRTIRFLRHPSLLTALILCGITSAAQADYAVLLEDCGGHTDYGLSADTDRGRDQQALAAPASSDTITTTHAVHEPPQPTAPGGDN